jgi:uncharacterized protein YjbI with pentapeptide repeats
MANPEHVSRLKDGIPAWNQWRQQISYSTSIDLSGVDLSGIDLRNADFWGADLSGVRLSHTNLSGANLTEANLSRADLTEADLSCARLNRAILTGADLSGALFYKASLNGVDLSGKLLRSVNLIESNLRETIFCGADLYEAKFRRADLFSANLSGADLNKADLSGAKLSCANLSKANLFSADLRKADLSRALLRNASLVWTNLSDSDLSGANLQKANLKGADLKRANLFETNFSKANLVEVKGFCASTTYIKDARFEPSATDWWSILRRTYSIPKATLTLLLIVLFFVPYAVRVHALTNATRSQQELSYTSDTLTESGQHPHSERSTGILPDIAAHGTTQPQACFAHTHEEHPLWVILLGVRGVNPIQFNETRGFPAWWLTVTVLIYGFLRLVLTLIVSEMREAEARSGYSPSVGNKWLLIPHYMSSCLALFVAICLPQHFYSWMNSPVWIPLQG